MDHVAPEKRSEIMRAVRAKDTRPEMFVRRLIHSLGYRYRLHVKNLPGNPDIVFRPRRKVIFIHGCFWHAHEGCSKGGLPKTRIDYWKTKLENNRFRDFRNQKQLDKLGWQSLVVWQCQLRDPIKLESELIQFLEDHDEKKAHRH